MGRRRDKTGPRPPRVESFDWGTMEWRMDDTLAEGTGMSVAVMTLRAGQTSPPHRHPNCGEFLYVARGRVEATLDGKKVALEAGDSVLTPAGTAHGLRNPGKKDAELVLSYSAGKRIYEAL